MARTAGSHADITGPRLAEAALRLFAEQGYAAVSMRQIASEVGVQAGALYNYTPDKQSLLFGLMQAHMLDLLAAWEAEERPPGAEAQLEAFTRFHIRYNHQRPEAVFISYMELRNLSADNFRTIEGLRRRYEDHLEAILRDGERAGRFTLEDSRLSTLAIIAMLTGVNTWYRKGGRLRLAEVEDIYWQMVRRSVTAL